MTVPAFVSYSSLRGRRTFPRSAVPWCHDSRGFIEVGQHGRYTFTAEQYARDVRRAAQEVGRMEWASILDWMCEPDVLARTGLTVREHQRRTVDSLLELRALAPDVHWAPVLQGWDGPQYVDHVDLYASAGVDLRAEPIVGLGSVCRRQGTLRLTRIARQVWLHGIRLHGFGVKASGLAAAGQYFISLDSQACSAHGRRRLPMPEHREAIGEREIVRARPVGKKPAPFPEELTVGAMVRQDWPAWSGYGRVNVPVLWRGRRGWVSWSATEGPFFSAHRNCANCLDYFMQWRADVVMPRLAEARARSEWNARSAA
jgi:hypothetical protein